MIDYKETAMRWLDQSAQDLKEAKKFLNEDGFSYACFFAEQSAQKSLKGYLILSKDLDVLIHAVSELLEKSSRFNPGFKNFIDRAKTLDKYYLTTRYPDALPDPLVPYKAHTKSEAEAAVALASEIFELCQKLTSDA